MKKILLSFVLLLACVGGWAQNVARLRFARTGTNASSVTVSVVGESGKAIEGASATLVSTSHDFKGTGNNVTESVLCPNVNANANPSPTIVLTFTVTGLNEFYTLNTLGLHIHALNGSGSYQQNFDNINRQWNVDVDAQGTDFGTLSDIDIAKDIEGSNQMWEVSSSSNINTGKEGLTITLTITRGTENKGCFFGLSEIKLTFNNKLDCDEIPSGFYRFKNISTNMYLAAPESLPTENDTYSSFTVTLSSEQDEAETHRDVWYVQNLGTNSSNADHANEVIYRIWCFQGGYGLGSDGNPRVVGSYNNEHKCPRLYSIQMTTDYKYVIAGHFYDDVNVGDDKNIFGLDFHDGGITNKKFLKPTDDKTTVIRAVEVTDKSNESAQWEISIVSPDELSKSVTIDDIRVGTFAFNSDVKIPEGIEAYVATERGERIRLTQLEDETIPARMGVVLRKTDESKNDFQFEAVHGLGIGMSAVNTEGGSPTPVDDKGNLLVGTLASKELAVGDYILTKKKVDGVATDEVVFGKISTVSNIDANKAYLPAEAVSQTRGFYTLMWGDDVETGIEEIQGAVQKDGIFVEGQQIVIVKNGLKYNAKGQRVK